MPPPVSLSLCLPHFFYLSDKSVCRHISFSGPTSNFKKKGLARLLTELNWPTETKWHHPASRRKRRFPRYARCAACVHAPSSALSAAQQPVCLFFLELRSLCDSSFGTDTTDRVVYGLGFLGRHFPPPLFPSTPACCLCLSNAATTRSMSCECVLSFPLSRYKINRHFALFLLFFILLTCLPPPPILVFLLVPALLPLTVTKATLLHPLLLSYSLVLSFIPTSSFSRLSFPSRKHIQWLIAS